MRLHPRFRILAFVLLLAVFCAAATVPQGKKTVSTAGVPVQLQSASQQVNGLLFQAWPANTGNIYIGTSTLNSSTGVGVIMVLGPGQIGYIGGKAQFGTEDPSLIYVDADVNGESTLWSIQQ